MKALFWNIRGFGARGRRDQLKDMVRSKNIDIIGLVETLKPSFSPNELSAVSVIDRYDWNFVASSGHSGGILLGTKIDMFDFVAFDHGIFWASTVVSHRTLNSLLKIMVVYGPADHAMSFAFLDEISIKIESCQLPLLIGGDLTCSVFVLTRARPTSLGPWLMLLMLSLGTQLFVRFLGLEPVSLGLTIKIPLFALFLIGFLFALGGILYSPGSVLEPWPVLALIIPP